MSGEKHQLSRLATALSSVMKDITERKNSEGELKYKLDLEKLIMNLSTKFINIAPDDIDMEINHALQVIGEFTHVDKGYVFLLSDNGLTVSNTHKWCADKEASQIEKLQGVPFDYFPWFAEKIMRLETIYIPRVADLPPEAGVEKAALQKIQVKSIIEVPMVSDKSFIGWLGLTSAGREITWSEDMIAC